MDVEIFDAPFGDWREFVWERPSFPPSERLSGSRTGSGASETVRFIQGGVGCGG